MQQHMRPRRGLTVTQQVIVEMARESGHITPRDFMKKYDITYRKLQENLHRLEDMGYLRRTHHWRLEFEAC